MKYWHYFNRRRVYPAVFLILGLASGYILHGHFVSASAPTSANHTSIISTPLPTPLPHSVNSSESLFVQIADQVIPSVVNISTTKYLRTPRMTFRRGADDFWQRFFDFDSIPQDRDSIRQPMSLGSGFVIEANGSSGLILTNYHVIADADAVSVKFTESETEKETPAEIVGRDPDLDLALLRVKTERKLQPVPMGDSDALKVGEWIAALGNPFGHGHSVSHGIVSAKARTLPGGFGKYLQVDAPINPGNSGGPLVNLRGEVVGINNAIDARGPGIGFAIPINSVKQVFSQLKDNGSVERVFIGINIGMMSPRLAKQLQVREDLSSPVVTHVLPGLSADRAGLKPYDVIISVDNTNVSTPDQLVEAITKVPVGKKVSLKVLRSGQELTLAIPVMKRPDSRDRS